MVFGAKESKPDYNAKFITLVHDLTLADTFGEEAKKKHRASVLSCKALAKTFKNPNDKAYE